MNTDLVRIANQPRLEAEHKAELKLRNKRARQYSKRTNERREKFYCALFCIVVIFAMALCAFIGWRVV